MSSGAAGNGSRTSFAWALMAGFDYDVAPNMTLEFGYRFLDYGSIKTSGWHSLPETGGGSSLQNCNGGALLFVAGRARFERLPDWPDLDAGRTHPAADRRGRLRRAFKWS